MLPAARTEPRLCVGGNDALALVRRCDGSSIVSHVQPTAERQQCIRSGAGHGGDGGGVRWGVRSVRTRRRRRRASSARAAAPSPPPWGRPGCARPPLARTRAPSPCRGSAGKRRSRSSP
eukprot:6200021-Pleurochrysis_carterae.AAC.1